MHDTPGTSELSLTRQMLALQKLMEARRSQCKLIWDSCIDLHCPHKPRDSQKNDRRKRSHSGPLLRRRNSIVGTRISYYEAKEPNYDADEPQVKLVFDDHAITTFEYETEEEALENYLREHPDERKDAEEQELQERINSVPDSPDDLKRDSPRVPSPDGSMKSNTVIGNSSTGALLSYKSKMTVDFQFGVPQESDDAHFDEPDRDLEQNHVNDNSMQLLPADENDLDAFSAESSKSDMLF